MNIIRHYEGRTQRVLGDKVTVKLPSARSPNALSIVRVEVPPGSGTPCVTHAKEEEVYLVCEGELVMHAPGTTHRLQPGDMVHVPPRTPHGYRNESQGTTRFIAWTIGGPMDRFFDEMAEKVQALPGDFDAMRDIMQRYGVERVR